MSSYFDELNSEIATAFGKNKPDDFIEVLVKIEERMIKEVSLVTGDREFPEELREKVQTLISSKRIKLLGGETNEHSKEFAESVGYSPLIQDMHSAFHAIGSKRIKTRFGVLCDSPSVILAMRKDHDEPVDQEDGSTEEEE